MNRIFTLITAVSRLAERVGTSLEWLSPAVARLTVGLVFFQSGWGKLHDLEKVTNYFTELGIPPRRSRRASPRRRSSCAAACCSSASPPASPSCR